MPWPGASKNPPTSPSNKSSNWPGIPKSQQSPAINPPSMRAVPALNENSTMADVAHSMKVAFDGLTVHEQAFANLPAQVKAQAAAAATEVIQNISSQTTSGVTAFNSTTGAILFFPNLSMIHGELGNPLYLTQQSDSGAKLIVGDSTPVTVKLNPSMVPPWFTFIGNDSSATAYLTTDSGASIVGLNSVYPGGLAIVFYDGTTFYCEGVAIATDSSLGVVQPDTTTIGVDSSGIISTIGATGTIHIPSVDSGMAGSITVVNGLITAFVNPT
jgi:hypothetical protein